MYAYQEYSPTPLPAHPPSLVYDRTGELSTYCTVDSTPLAVMQEDFLVICDRMNVLPQVCEMKGQRSGLDQGMGRCFAPTAARRRKQLNNGRELNLTTSRVAIL